MNSKNNPVVQATRQYLGMFYKEEEVSTGTQKVFSYQDDFRALWEKIDKPVSGTDREYITVVWDAIPQRDNKASSISGANVDTGEYLTPLDWAVAYSLAVFDASKYSKQYPNLKIYIIDLASETRKTSPSVRFFDMFPRRHVKSMPWIRLIKVITKDETEWSMTELVGNTHKSLPMESFSELSLSDPGLFSELDMIRSMWAGAITRTNKPDDHHAIANIIGPQLLLNNSVLEQDDHVFALRTLLKSLGLSRVEDDVGLAGNNEQWINAQGINAQEGPIAGKLSRVLGSSNEARLGLILIDDQWIDGWGEVICNAVGVPYRQENGDSGDELVGIGESERFVITAGSNPERLLAHIEADSGSDQRFRLLQGGDSSFRPAIVFLDLRLFAGKPINEEALFFNKLVTFARRFPEDEPTLPWPGFSEGELSRVSTWAEGVISGDGITRDHPAYIEALTFLPRILSLVDLALPIVIFSSTGKRDITDKFRSYGNVITDFEKPRLSGDIGREAKNKFVNAFEKSMDILVARKKCFELVSLKRPNASIDKGSAYIEMFIDEDGSRGDTVGGCFAVFTGEKVQDAKEKADLFDDNLVRNGVRYFGGTTCINLDKTEIGPQTPRIMDKKAACNIAITETLNGNEKKQSPDFLGVARLKNGLIAGELTHDDLLNPTSVDNLFYLTLGALVELFLFETVPAIIGEKVDVVVSIYAGTRVKFTRNLKEVRNDRYRFGVAVNKKDEDKQFSISKDDIYPLTASLLAMHGCNVSVDRAIAIQLPYRSSKFIRYPEDFICRKCNVITSINTKEDIKEGKLQSVPLCKNCRSSDYLRPDYRALHYVADEVLFRFPKTENPGIYSKIFKSSVRGQFDGLLDEELQRSLAASRKMDFGDVVGATIDVMIPSQDNSQYVPSGHFLISTRLAPLLYDLDGREFMDIAARMVHESIEWVVIRKSEAPDIDSVEIRERASNWPRSGNVNIKKNRNGNAYIGVLQEGPDQGKSVLIPNSLVMQREGDGQFALRISYLERSDVNPNTPYKAKRIIG